MNESEVLQVLQKVGAFSSGHFIFVSGLHADTYINKNAIYPYTEEVSALCREIAERWRGKGIEAVVGPATGGIILSQWTAHHLSDIERRPVYSAYADKDGDGFVIKRGYDNLIRGKKAIVVEDLVTTGSSVRKVVGAARLAGASVAGAVALCNRGEVTKAAVGDPPEFFSLLSVHLEQWPVEMCELCKRGIPVSTELGHGKQYLATQEKPQY